jgi:hypothetical protein
MNLVHRFGVFGQVITGLNERSPTSEDIVNAVNGLLESAEEWHTKYDKLIKSAEAELRKLDTVRVAPLLMDADVHMVEFLGDQTDSKGTCEDDPYVSPKDGLIAVTAIFADELEKLIPVGARPDLISQFVFEHPEGWPLRPILQNRVRMGGPPQIFEVYRTVDVLRTFRPDYQLLMHALSRGYEGTVSRMMLFGAELQEVSRFDGNRLFWSSDPRKHGILNSLSSEIYSHLCEFIYVRWSGTSEAVISSKAQHWGFTSPFDVHAGVQNLDHLYFEGSKEFATLLHWEQHHFGARN